MTQQTACSFGQSWPTLVYLPICSFYDTTVQHQLGLDDPRGYWKVVAPHEVAHQWWGQLVSWNSYRDQWMSEGFAEMSASLFMQAVYGQKDPNAFVKFWHDERELLTERNKEGWRAIDAGPVTLGYRLANTRGGMSIPRRLIYPKGGYILHMVRMMMWAPHGGDNLFRETMQDFTHTYANRAATTEDFKAILEKHMTAQMDLDHNHRLDWFFNQYVYGTALPSYSFDYSFHDQNGTPVLKIKLTQANVDDSFKMLVPIYLELADGRVVRMGSAAMIGNKTIEQEVPLTGYKEQPKRAMLNFYADVLATDGK
jgi:aminopeptidase N